LFAAHQLVGPIADWWDAYVEAHEEPETINWQEFRNSFITHHVPLGVVKLKKKEFKDLKQGSMTVSEYVTRFTQLSHYAPDNVDNDEKKQDWFLNKLNDGLAYALILTIFKTWWTRLYSLKIEGQLWSARGRCNTLEPKEATRSFMMVLLLKDPSFVLVNSKGCRLQHRDSRLPSIIYSTPTFSLLALHHRHYKGTTIHRILELWDHATVVVRLGTMLIGV
jgi:hypothetical protein